MSFRRAILRRQREGGASPATALTSMIDVVFLLMIFFLFGSLGLGERQIVARLSGSGAATATGASACTWITIRPDPVDGAQGAQFRVDGGSWTGKQGVIEAELVQALESSSAGGIVIVDALPGVSFQRVIDAMSISQRCGATDVSLRTE